jgi:two-component system, LuxR family, sensor kinase FixL
MQNEDQALLAAILSTAVDAIIVINSRGTIQSVNQATSRLFGYSDGEMLGNNVRMLMPSPYHEEHDGYLERYHRTGRAKIIGVGREVTGKRKDDSTFPMHLAVSEVVLGDNKLFAGIVRDTSDLRAVQRQLIDANEQLEQRVRQRTEELKAAQADLIKAEKMATLGQVSGGIAHEIRNPLNAIRTSAYYLRSARALSPEKMQEHLERIDRQVTLIDSVITALSDIARLPEPNAVSCDVNALIRQVISTVSIPDNITIENKLTSDLSKATIDPNQIAIVFRNLLRNARDAMPNGGTILLRMSNSSWLKSRIVVSESSARI